jgi:D-glycero-D-manno-heptose 1,7-bisphosphate phosphatase
MNTTRQNKAFFLDRDGVVIKDVPYLSKVDEIEFLPGVDRAIKRINDYGYKCIVITNQSGIARGLISLDELSSINTYLRNTLKRKGAIIDAFYVCPHHPDGKVKEYAIKCSCRKPGNAMILQAAVEHNLDLSRSIMIGDQDIDVEAGIRAGCNAFLMYKPNLLLGRQVTLNNLEEAVKYIYNYRYRKKEG